MNENNGITRVRPQAQTLRPDLTINDASLHGEVIMMTTVPIAPFYATLSVHDTKANYLV